MDDGRAGQGHESGESPAGVSPTRWAQIWARRNLLLRVARRNGAGPEDAEDVVQQAMLRAGEHSEIADEQLQAWLITVTTRLCVDGHRRRASETRRWQRVSHRAAVAQPGQRPEDEVCDRAEAAWVASQATGQLPPRQAEALRLIAEGCDIGQVATELGVHHRAAESLLARARRTLRAVLTASLGVLIPMWRTPGVLSGQPVAVALACAAVAVAVAVTPAVLVAPAPGGPDIPARQSAQPAPSARPSAPPVSAPARTPQDGAGPPGLLLTSALLSPPLLASVAPGLSPPAPLSAPVAPTLSAPTLSPITPPPVSPLDPLAPPPPTPPTPELARTSTLIPELPVPGR